MQAKTRYGEDLGLKTSRLLPDWDPSVLRLGEFVLQF
jgi:hypothetical protein